MSCSKQMPSHISFAEIIHDRDSSVRVTHDNMIYAVDLVMVMTGSDRRYAAQVLFDHAFCMIKVSQVCILHPWENPRMQNASMGFSTDASCTHGKFLVFGMEMTIFMPLTGNSEDSQSNIPNRKVYREASVRSWRSCDKTCII